MRCGAGASGTLLLAAMLLALFAAGCASSADAPAPTTSPPAAEAATPGATMPATGGAQTPLPAPLDETAVPAASVASGEPARVVYRGDPSRRMVALTFDAGADPGYTALILETLHREGVRASFGITGLWAEQNRDLLLAIAAEGHTLINHSYDHASFTGLSSMKPPLTQPERALELSRTETTIYHLSQRTTRPYFRPPFGDLDPGVQRDVAAAGYGTIVMWTVDSLGWKHASADDIFARCIAQAEPGAIYVMHVGGESQDGPALGRVIDGLRAAGYAFGTIEEVLAPP